MFAPQLQVVAAGAVCDRMASSIASVAVQHWHEGSQTAACLCRTLQGAVGLNASTSHDATRFYVSLPANKLELWLALEAERFRAPAWRQLYREKSVVLEERRLRVDNSPLVGQVAKAVQAWSCIGT